VQIRNLDALEISEIEIVGAITSPWLPRITRDFGAILVAYGVAPTSATISVAAASSPAATPPA
jgi:hypothetical protein